LPAALSRGLYTSRRRSAAAAARRPYEGHDDAALTQALAQGDELAFREIYERHWYGLFQAVRHKLGSQETAEEIVQEIFTSLWQKRAESSITHLSSYLHTAVKFRVIDFLRTEYHRKHYLTIGRPPEAELDFSTEEAVAANDLSAALASSVEQLPEQTREVFRLSRTEHRTVPEIAALLNISPKTVEYHLTRALKLLRSGLRDFLVLLLWWYW
jgi:RNA polymerase sigma-70 factor (ECF subfamily)